VDVGQDLQRNLFLGIGERVCGSAPYVDPRKSGRPLLPQNAFVNSQPVE
jgi:hypothetical protein